MATAGDINAGAATAWPLLTAASERVLVLDTPITVGGWDNAACDFWVRIKRTLCPQPPDAPSNLLTPYGRARRGAGARRGAHALAGLDRLRVLSGQCCAPPFFFLVCAPVSFPGQWARSSWPQKTIKSQFYPGKQGKGGVQGTRNAFIGRYAHFRSDRSKQKKGSVRFNGLQLENVRKGSVRFNGRHETENRTNQPYAKALFAAPR